MLDRDSVLIRLVPYRASLHLARDASLHKGEVINQGTSRIGFWVKLAADERVAVPSERVALEDLEGSVSVIAGPLPDGKEACGRFSFHKADHDAIDPWPASYGADVLVTPMQFTEILHCTSAGLLPSTISLQVEGLQYGNAMDGSEKVWKSVEGDQRVRSVSEVSFNFTLARTEGDDISHEDVAESDLVPVTKRDIRRMRESLAGQTSEFTKSIRSGFSRVFWAVIAVGVLILLRR